MSARGDLEDPILMDCPGSGCPANLVRNDGAIGHCKFCNVARWLHDGLIPDHYTVDIIAMIERGDFGPRSVKNRSKQ